MYFRSYTCLTEHILVLQILYLFYRTYSCLTDLILVFQNLFLSYGSYTCVIELILVFRILFLCEGNRRYDKSEQIRIISHTRSDHIKYIYQVYTDSNHIPKQTELSVYIIIIFRLIQFLMLITGLCLFYQYGVTRRYYRDFTCTKVPVGTT